MFAQQLVNGVLLGATYALFALGFTLTFGVLRVINLLYGFYVSAGALGALGLVHVGVPFAAALPLAAVATGAAAVVIDTALLGRLRARRAPELASLMVTLGGALALYAGTAAWLGPDVRRLPPDLLGNTVIAFAGLRLGAPQLLILAAAGVIVTGLLVLLHRTRLGLAIRAMATEPEAAALMGINTGRLAAAVSCLSGALAGCAGVLIGVGVNAIHPYMGEALMLRGFVVVIVGGMGSVGGAVIAGLGLGVIEVLTAAYIDSGLKEAVAFALLVAVLWTRPSGLFGVLAVRRA